MLLPNLPEHTHHHRVSSSDPQPLPTKVTTLLSPYCFTQAFLEEGPPKLHSLTTPQQIRLPNLCLCCLQYPLPASDVRSVFNATSHPTVLPASSHCLSAQSFITPQALPISQNPSRQPPASCLPFPVSQFPPKQCLSPILPTIKFTPLQHLTSLSRQPLASVLYPPTTPHSSSHHTQSSMCMSYHYHGVQLHVPK